MVVNATAGPLLCHLSGWPIERFERRVQPGLHWDPCELHQVVQTRYMLSTVLVGRTSRRATRVLESKLQVPASTQLSSATGQAAFAVRSVRRHTY